MEASIPVQLDAQLQANLRALPELRTDGMCPVQVEAICNLETSLEQNRAHSISAKDVPLFWEEMLHHG